MALIIVKCASCMGKCGGCAQVERLGNMRFTCRTTKGYIMKTRKRGDNDSERVHEH